MAFLLISGMVICGWVFLCVLSGERQRKVWERDAQAASIAADEAAQAAELATGTPSRRVSHATGHGVSLSSGGSGTL